MREPGTSRVLPGVVGRWVVSPPRPGVGGDVSAVREMEREMVRQERRRSFHTTTEEGTRAEGAKSAWWQAGGGRAVRVGPGTGPGQDVGGARLLRRRRGVEGPGSMTACAVYRYLAGVATDTDTDTDGLRRRASLLSRDAPLETAVAMGSGAPSYLSTVSAGVEVSVGP